MFYKNAVIYQSGFTIIVRTSKKWYYKHYYQLLTIGRKDDC
ncbi:hypothetical protein HMPREF1866_01013 [Lachnoanaerobaculum saburreum]|uniref:Uncharacterized protein n=1 Tax=Lachnoanaerobaculum saburreum TaxID=467210 RepID=A0A133ZUS3_9FIRM|nr:hypothetical protein HMPREF9099_02135 [Lachnospiraceae bacterium oral taxon 082 str. F0431]KXB59197.1 hypothetical protein HMPREF1866_01013 [Lachnoanaerobaculum saburreum]